MPTIRDIADGAPFDTVTAIRQICTYLDNVEVIDHDYDTKPDLPPPIDNRELQGKATLEPPRAAYSTDATEHPLAILLNQRLAALLIANGYHTPLAIKSASDAELLAIDGIAEKTLAQIRKKLPAIT